MFDAQVFIVSLIVLAKSARIMIFMPSSSFIDES